MAVLFRSSQCIVLDGEERCHEVQGMANTVPWGFG